MGFLNGRAWSPYLAGALAGLVLCISVFVAGKYFGASTTFVRTAGLIENTVAAERVAQMPYFVKTKIKVDWQMMFVVGIAAGALVASLISGTFKIVLVPPMWRERFGSSFIRRASVAFIGGIIAIFGARLAGGCPSGHGLSGLAQLSVSGFISLALFFIVGVIVALSLYRKGA
jgi:hypothetical protein